MPVDDQERGILVPEWRKPEPELEFTPEQRKRNLYARKDPLRVMPRDKSQPVHEKPATRETVLRVHPNAIEVGTSMGEGAAKFLGFGGIASIGMAFLFLYVVTPVYYISVALYLLFIIFPALFFFGGALLIRRAYFCPSDHPVLFNKESRGVHVIPVRQLNMFKFWEKGKPGKMRSYHWKHVTARTYRRLDAPGGTIARTETVLQLLCSTPEQPDVVDEIVSLGLTGGWSDDYQVSLWEHIRRYMEEDGPPLQPGDRLRKINLDKVPEFPPEIVAAAGGPALSDAELAKWTRAGVSASA